jgi:hypothetical protein
MTTRSACAAAVLTALAAAPASAYQWSQTGGGSFRSGMWPPLVSDPEIRAAEEDAPALRHTSAANPFPPSPPSRPLVGDAIRAATLQSSSSPSSIPSASRLGALPSIQRATSLMYELNSNFRVAKTPALVVASSGYVVLLTEECYMAALPNPDVPGVIWRAGSERWKVSSAVNGTQSRCYDVVLDENDNLYHPVRLDNIDRGYLWGWNTNGFTNAPTQAWAPIDLGGDLRLFTFYTISMLYASSHVWVPMGGSNGVGLTIVSTKTGTPVDVSMGPLGFEGVTGSVKIPNPAIGGPDFGAFVMAHELDASGVFMRAFDVTGKQKWATTAQGFTDIDQPHPLMDPFTGNLYLIGFNGPLTIYCFYRTTGGHCAYPWSDTGVSIADSFDGFVASWVYAGAIVINPNGNSVDRLIYTFPLLLSTNEPVGCIMAVAPKTGYVLDTYCIPRDPNDFLSSTNFVATAPLVALNARGQGAHTVYVGQFDATIFAFDPYNLAQGPLYRARPDRIKQEATIATDFLTMTSGGTLLFPVWEDDDGLYGVVAIPNINAIPPNMPTNNAPADDGITPGASAAIAIISLGLVAAAIGFPVYRAGGFSPALERYAGVKGGLAGLHFAVPDSVRNLLPASMGGSSYAPIGVSSSSGLSGGAGGATSYSSGSYQSSSSSSSAGGSGGAGYNAFGSASTDL